MATQERILDAALKLFNEHGTSAVSTNHIAEGVGISPGNLYYHYRNKDAIIRALFEQLFDRWDKGFQMTGLPTLESVKRLARENFQIMTEYRFIYRELMALLHQDAELRERFIVVRRRGYEGFQGLMASLVEAKILAAPMDTATVTYLADLVWMISEFWLPTLEISGYRVNAEQMERGVDLMMSLLRPYLSTE